MAEKIRIQSFFFISKENISQLIMRFSNLFVVLVTAGIAVAEMSFKTTRLNRPAFAPTWLDMLRERYLDVEESLWGVVSSGLEQSYVLQQVHSGHRTFLSGNFLESQCYLSTFDPDQRVLHDAIEKINESVNLTVGRYLHASRRLFNERDALQISLQNERLTDDLDKLYDVAGTTDFYYTIKKVGVCVETRKMELLVAVTAHDLNLSTLSYQFTVHSSNVNAIIAFNWKKQSAQSLSFIHVIAAKFFE